MGSTCVGKLPVELSNDSRVFLRFIDIFFQAGREVVVTLLVAECVDCRFGSVTITRLLFLLDPNSNKQTNKKS